MPSSSSLPLRAFDLSIIKAYGNPDDIRGQVKPRDQAEYENEDMIFLRIDPFGDSRSNYILGSNAFGSQVDLRVKNATSEEDTFDEEISSISATKITSELREKGKL